LTEKTVAAVARAMAFEQPFVRSEQSTIETAITVRRISGQTGMRPNVSGLAHGLQHRT
jgi:hypothetical protein